MSCSRVAGAELTGAFIKVQQFLSQSRQTFAAELLLGREKAAPGAQDSPTIHHLTETKRFGNPLATYLARGHPRLCGNLRVSTALAKRTPVFHVWYTAPCASWYNLEYFLNEARTAHLELPPKKKSMLGAARGGVE